MLAACNGGGGGSSGGGTATSQSLSGGGIKGPLVNAIVTVYAVDTTAPGFKGAVVGVPGSTNDQAQITGLSLPFPLAPPYILEFTSDAGTTDIMTGEAPVISEMRTVITQALLDNGEQIYATPLTTMAVDLAILNADVDTGPWAAAERDLDLDDDETDDLTISLGDSAATSDELLSALPIAAAQVKSTMGFGMSEEIDIFDTPPLIDDTTDTGAEQEDAAAYRAAVEAVTAVVAQIDDAVGTEDPNAVLSALTADLADGEIDGKADDESGVSQTSEIFGGETEGSGETAIAALQILEQDPASLPIPNDPEGRTVGEMKQIISDEKEDLGNTTITTEIDVEEVVELKPAETNPDIDGDGVPNDQDAFPEDDSETIDTDGDGTGNNADTDDDNDGVADGNDDFPLDPSEQTDTDNDGTGNNADTDDDGDGVEDSADDFPLDASSSSKTDQDDDGWSINPDNPSESQDPDDTNANIPGILFVDTDKDGKADSGGAFDDTDDDGDGAEDTDDAFPLIAAEQKDTDGDGTGDNSDTDIDGDGVNNDDDSFPRNPFETIDTDRDGVGNNTDEDDDGDGVDDAQETQNGSDPLKRDTDGDGVLDNVDQAPTDPAVQFDSDDDGIDNAADNCPVHYNPTQSNVDGDERGDDCDKDADNDGTDNVDDAFPLDDSETTDTDGDGIGNNTDEDDDNDGVADVDDAFSTDATETKDTDSDGTGDNADTDIDGDGTDNSSDAFPFDASEDTDTDGDGVGNNTDEDDDGDGTDDVSDDFPLIALASTDTDGDGEPNVTDTDDDNDGTPDTSDAFPLNANEDTDTDGDGTGDNADTDIDGDGVSNEHDAFPTDGNEFIDSDGDGTGDKADTDRDGDGTDNAQDAFPLNANEDTDTDGDGIGNNEDQDDDNDGLSDSAEGTAGSNPLLRDTDGDGRRDGADNCPVNDNADQFDRDGDGAGDACDTDADGDTILEDGTDNCPTIPNTNQNDADEDGTGDACDTDVDGDGVDNHTDNCPVTSNSDQVDADGNGIGDVCDDDEDQDGIVGVLDNCPTNANPNQLDTDHDGQGNACDTDDDNDGISDTQEASDGTNPLLVDTDGDGVNDQDDAFPTDATETKDTDGDGTGDNADTDGDNDGVNDDVDNCPAIANGVNEDDQIDTDSDGKGNACDTDDDGDGVADSFDAFPLIAAESQDQDLDGVGDNADNCPINANGENEDDQADNDGDGIGDACDHDNDGDGIPEGQGGDNCPTIANPSQHDMDEDGEGDACDTDDDGDGTPDTSDNCPLISNDQTNTDGATDGGDACDLDDDNDGLSDAEEAAFGTNPLLADTDTDGTNDNVDNCPTDANVDQADQDGNGQGDVCDIDTDGDGVLNADEAGQGTDPANPDSDSDGTNDGLDNCPALSNTDQLDTDEDGDGNACDDDDDNDTVLDSVDNCPTVPNPGQENTNGSTVGDACVTDTDEDGVPDAIDNCPAIANTDQANNDQDSEGDLCDTDDDNDTVADDVDNCPVDANTNQVDLDEDTQGDVCDTDDDADGVLDTVDNCPIDANGVNEDDQSDIDGDSLGDACDFDDDGDGIADTSDNCPAIENEDQLNSDTDAQGNACDTDDDNDTILDVDEAAQGTDPLLADTDGDGDDDANDNCPVIANADQADSDGNGIGDACDGVADLSGFWQVQRTLTAIEFDNAGSQCEGTLNDVDAGLVMVKQDNATVEILFADNGFHGDGDTGTVSAASVVSWGSDEEFDEHGSAGFEFSVSETWSFTGTPDNVSTPTVLSDTSATEVNTFFDGEGQTGNQTEQCRYTYTASMTRMSQVDAADVLDAQGVNQGMVYIDSDHRYIGETNVDVFEFGYGVIDDVNGEREFFWNDVTNAWETDPSDNRYMLSANGWGEVADRISVSGTPGVTADLVTTDGSTIYSTMQVKAFQASLTGLPFKSAVEEDLVKHSATPEGDFASTASSTFIIEAVNQTDAFAIECDIHDGNYSDLGLNCVNAYIPDWTNHPEFSQTDLATSIGDAIHANGVSSSGNDKGLWIGRSEDGMDQVYAFLNGADTSGANGTSGTVSFALHHFSAQEPSAILDEASAPVSATWTISQPLSSSESVLVFEIPEFLFKEFDIEWRDSKFIIMAAVEAGDTQSFLRFGGMTPAGAVEHFPLINVPALDEVIANFDYNRPDTDGDGESDDVDNCPDHSNADQADSDGNGRGDVCDSTQPVDDIFTSENVHGDYIITFPGAPGEPDDKAFYTFNNNGTGTVFFSDGPTGGESFIWSVANGTLTLDITTETGSHDLDLYTIESGTVEGGTLNATIDEGNDGSIDYVGPAEWERDNTQGGNDSDGDGVDDNVDNCPAVSNSDQADSDGNGVGDACEGTTTIADADSDGVLDADDAFPDDATEQRDTDGDGVGNNGDACPYLAGSNQTSGDCADPGVDMSGEYLLAWSVDGTNPDNREYDDQSDSCVAVTETTGTELVHVRQVGNQVIFEGGDGEDHWMDIGTILANGTFTVTDTDGDPAESFSMAGTYTSGTISGTFTESRETSNASDTCTENGNFTGAQPTDITESDVGSTGVTWFESDREFVGQAEIGEFEYGVLSESLEQLFEFNPETGAFDDVTSEVQGAGESRYLTSGGIVVADDLFIITGYGASGTDVTGEGANAQPTDGGVTVAQGAMTVDLAEFDVDALPINKFLHGFDLAIDDTSVFATGARAYIGEITPVETTYSYWCDDDWSPWFDANLDCDNVVPKGYVDPDGDGEYDPVPATSFADVFSTPAELSAQPVSQTVADRGIWVGEGYDMGGEYSIRAYLQSTSGDETGLSTDVAAGVGFVKAYRDSPLVFNIGSTTLSTTTVGSVQVVEVELPENIAQLANSDKEESHYFLFVDASSETAGPILRRGEVRTVDNVEHELLFNDIARTNILAAFDYTVPDSDGDGKNDAIDNCPSVSNADQLDTNGNGIGDACEGTTPSDTDGDGVDDSVDNCKFTSNPNQTDTDGDGIGDACESTTTIADADSDGVLDGDDAFPDDASEQRDTDGDGVGDNGDACPYLAGSNQTSGDCADPGVDMSGEYLLTWSVDGSNANNRKYDKDSDACVAVTETAGNELVRVRQVGNQVIFEGDDGDYHWMDIGTIQSNGSFTVTDTDNDPAEDFTMSGTYGSGSISGTFVESRETSDASDTCIENGNFTGVQPTAITESDVDTTGVTWIDSDSEWDEQAQKDVFEYEYGTLSGSAEQMFTYDMTSESWVNTTSEAVGAENFLTSAGLVIADDLFQITGYGASGTDATGEVATIKVTDGGVAVDYETSLLELGSLDISTLPLKLMLDGDFEGVFQPTDVFSSGALAYVGEITPSAQTYRYWCDDDWDIWFDSNLDCDNIVHNGSEDPDGDGVYDPIPATSFDDVFSTAAELLAEPVTQTVINRALWIGSGYDSGGDYNITAFLESTSGNGTGLDSDPNAGVTFVKNYNNTSDSFNIAETTISSSLIGSIQVVEFVVPKLVAHLADRDDEESNIFLFVDTTESSFGDIVRRGEVRKVDQVNKELLFNDVALADILAAFNPMPPAAPAGENIGAWLLDEQNGNVNVLVFINEGSYIIGHTGNQEPDSGIGQTVAVSAEHGTYVWDDTSGGLTVSPVAQSDGQGGLSDMNTMTMSVDANTLTINDSVEGSIPFQGIVSQTEPLVGAWLLPEPDSLNILVFMDDANYIIMHTNNAENDDVIGQVVPTSAEYGNYTWNASTGAFTATPQGESDGPGGLSDPGGSFTLTLNGDELTLNDGSGDAVFRKVGADPFALASGNNVNFDSGTAVGFDIFGVAGSGFVREYDDEEAGTEVFEYYVFSDSDDTGRWVRDEEDLDTGSSVLSVDEAMTWTVEANGNLKVTMDSDGSSFDGEVHAVALESMADTHRPMVVIEVDGILEAPGLDKSMRLVSEAAALAEIGTPVDLTSNDDVIGNFHYDFDQNEQVRYISDGTVEFWEDNGSGGVEFCCDGTWSLDPTTDTITVTEGDTWTVLFEDISADTTDVDDDGDTTELVYKAAGWWDVDSSTSLGVFYRDTLLEIQP